MTDVTLFFKADSDELVTADKRLDTLNKTGKKTEKAVSAVGNSFSRNNHKIQNTAFQLQDIVVQLEQGTSVSRTLGQQLPQLLGGFGALGAVAGVAAGLVFALGGVLVSSLNDSAEASKNLKESLEELDAVISITDAGVIELSDSFKKLSTVGGVAFAAGLKEAVNDAKDAIKNAKLESINLAKALSPNELGGKFDLTTLRVSILRNKFTEGTITLQEFARGLDEVSVKGGKLTKDFRDLRESIIKQAESSESAFKRLEELRRIEDGATISTNEHQKSVDRLIASLQVQSQAANDSGNSTSFYRAQQLGATEAELARINSLQGLIDAQKDLAEQEAAVNRLADAEASRANAKASSFDRSLSRLQDSLRTEEEATRDSYNERSIIIKGALDKQLIDETEAAELRKRLDQETAATRLNQTQDLFGQLSGLASSENRELFEIGKAASLANATIKGIESAIDSFQFGSSIGGPVVGAAFAAASGLATGALLAQINSASPPGRAQGGQVRPGQSYRVGEFGPETITLGSNGGTVTPNAANDGGGLEVVNNIQIIGGNKDAKVTTTSSRVGDRKFVQDIVVDLMANQTSPARQALQATSNVQSRGSR